MICRVHATTYSEHTEGTRYPLLNTFVPTRYPLRPQL